MRIAYLCSDPGVPVDGHKGASIHVREMAGAFAGLGHDVLVLAARGAPAEPLVTRTPSGGRLTIAPLPAEPFDDVLRRAVRDDATLDAGVAWSLGAMLGATSFRHRARPLLADPRPSFIYERLSLFGTSGVALAGELQVPLVLEVNAPLSDEQARHRSLGAGGAAGAIEETVLRAADRVVAVSPPLGRWAEEGGAMPGRVHVLANAVDPARFAAAAADRGRVRARHGLGEDPVVGFLGTLKPWHDVAGLIDAVAALHAGGWPVRLLIVGDGPERAALEERALARGIAAQVAFAGSVAYDDVPAHLAAMDVGVAPYAADGPAYFSPIKLFEYLAASLPVIAAEIEGTAECLARTGGWGYRTGDVDGLADAIRDAISDRDRAASIAAAGLAHVVGAHTWRQNAAAVLALVGDDVRAPAATAGARRERALSDLPR